MFALAQIQNTADTEELTDYVSQVLEKLQFILNNQDKFTLSFDTKHAISNLLEHTIPEIFNNYFSFPLEYRNKNIVHDGQTLKQLLIKQLTEIIYQVNTIEKTVFQNNEMVFLAQLKQLENKTLHNNEFEPNNQPNVEIISSFNYDEYKQQAIDRTQNKEVKSITNMEEVAQIQVSPSYAVHISREDFPYQYESHEKYSQANIDAMLASNISKFSNLDDIHWENNAPVYIDIKKATQIRIEDVIRHNVVNPKLKFVEHMNVRTIPQVTAPIPLLTNAATLGSETLTIPNVVPIVQEYKNLVKPKSAKNAVFGFGALFVCALVCWGIFANNSQKLANEQAQVIASAKKEAKIASLNKDYPPFKVNYSSSTTSKPYTIVYKGFDPINVRLAQVEVVGDFYNGPSGKQEVTIKYDTQFYTVETGEHIYAKGFYAESVTNGVIVLQKEADALNMN